MHANAKYIRTVNCIFDSGAELGWKSEYVWGARVIISGMRVAITTMTRRDLRGTCEEKKRDMTGKKSKNIME